MDARLTPYQALEAARVAGFDLNLIDTNLALSVEERWRQHDMAPDLITTKEAVGREKDLLAAKELRAIAAKRAQR